jgi:CheY-like chemotaxis protein
MQPMRKRILVVSDDPTLAFSRVALLRKSGYLAESVSSDDAAMELLEVERFDLVLLGRDPLLPGRSLDRRLRERHPDLLTLKIEGNVPVPSTYPSRITDARPERVLAVLEEMLRPAAGSPKAPARSSTADRSISDRSATDHSSDAASK